MARHRGDWGARKARIALEGRGKRGGARLVYYWHTAEGEIYLLTVYAKNEREDLTHDDKKKIKALIEAYLEAEG